MKKFIVLLIICLLCGCSPKEITPQETIDTLFKELKIMDISSINEISESSISDSFVENWSSLLQSTENHPYKTVCITYLQNFEVTSSLEYQDDTTAVFLVNLKLYNLKEAREQFLEYFVGAFEYYNETEKYNDALAEAYTKALDKTAPSFILTFTITLNKSNEKWLIQDSESLLTNYLHTIKNQLGYLDYQSY